MIIIRRKVIVLFLMLTLVTGYSATSASAYTKYRKVWCKKHHRYHYYRVTRKQKQNLNSSKKSSQANRALASRGANREHPYESVIKQIGALYWTDPSELDALVWVSAHECRKPGVVSRTGCVGLFQLRYPPAWMERGDPASETRAGCEYIKRRYGTPLKAKAFWLNRGWY